MRGKLCGLIQIIDMSSNILYQQEKSQNEFLSLINACVSHELRNPLNSIKAQNIEKNFLYEEIEMSLN
jgi:signal transduction histidine kinase